jgi:tetratricopeptide (TPR) repeat protein
LNSDDLYLPGTIHKAVETLEKFPEIGLVYGNLLSINARGEHVNTLQYQQYALEDLLAFLIIGQPAVFIRREVLERVGYLSQDYHYLLDHQLWLRIAAETGMKFVPRPWAAARYHSTAKNIAQAEHFGAEAFRILDWAKTQPKMAKMIQQSEDRVLGGIYRFNAQYLLDSGQPRKALKAYGKVFKYYPEFAFRRLHRVVFAFFSLFGLGGLGKLFRRRYMVAPSKDRSRTPISVSPAIVLPSDRSDKQTLPKDVLPPVLVTGAHRSSTTWVGKMLAANQGYTYISEPLNVLHRRGVMRKPIRHWYAYINFENEDEVLSGFYATMSLRYHLIEELNDLRSVKDAARMVRDWSSFTLGRKAGNQVILKDPFAVFSVDWFFRRLGCEVVISVRHPAAFVNSLKRLNWHFQFEDLLVQPLLMRDWLEPFREEMIYAQQQAGDIVFQASLLWRIIYSAVYQTSLAHPKYYILKHEDLSLNPLDEFKTLFDALGVPFTEQVKAAIQRSSSPDNPTELSKRSVHSVKLDSRMNLKNWQNRLSADEIARVRILTEDVASYYYKDEDW